MVDNFRMFSFDQKSSHHTRMARIGKHWTGKNLALKRRGLHGMLSTHNTRTPLLETLPLLSTHAPIWVLHSHTHAHTHTPRQRQREKCLWSMSDFCTTLFQMPIFNESWRRERREKLWADRYRLPDDISTNGTFLMTSNAFKYRPSFLAKNNTWSRNSRMISIQVWVIAR